MLEQVVVQHSRNYDWLHQLVRESPDYAHLIVPRSLDRWGFEKLARALTGAGIALTYDDAGIDGLLVEWDEIPVVSVKIRED